MTHDGSKGTEMIDPTGACAVCRWDEKEGQRRSEGEGVGEGALTFEATDILSPGSSPFWKGVGCATTKWDLR